MAKRSRVMKRGWSPPAIHHRPITPPDDLPPFVTPKHRHLPPAYPSPSITAAALPKQDGSRKIALARWPSHKWPRRMARDKMALAKWPLRMAPKKMALARWPYQDGPLKMAPKRWPSQNSPLLAGVREPDVPRCPDFARGFCQLPPRTPLKGISSAQELHPARSN